MMGFRWGIIGFGWVARDHAAPGIEAAGGMLAAVADPDPAARAAAEALGARAFPSPDALLAARCCDALYVATPNHLHRAAVEAAAAAGLPVLCEKPMAATLADAEAMAQAVRRAGTPYGTAFDQRHHPAHEAMRAMIREGRIGTPVAVRIVYACWLGPGWCADNWRADPARAGGGALMDLAPHGLDLAQFLLDDGIADIAALKQSRVQDYAVDDGAMLVARLAGGALASLHVAYNHPEHLPRRRLEVLGTGGLLLAEDTMGQVAGGRLFHDGAPVPFADGDPFARQMAAFQRFVTTGQGEFSLERDVATARWLHAANAAPLPVRAAA
ncbi:MAG: Gfo/Idh/MocA family oxidoreductase [Acetobacteraceae bacterium]|nr:Gfo/Idh/MocA family oxidoreductase [Acetobacteraceae bacterium]